MPHVQSSHVYNCFEFEIKNKNYKYTEKKKNDKNTAA